jgi:hypothetical protein
VQRQVGRSYRELSARLRVAARLSFFSAPFALCLSTVNPGEGRMNMHEKSFCCHPRQIHKRMACSAI